MVDIIGAYLSIRVKD